MKSLSYLALTGALLVGCASEPEWGWKRSDGQSARNDPVLHAQFESDKSACVGEMQKTGLSGATSNGVGITAGLQPMRRNAAMDLIRECMAQRGYTTVPVTLAESSELK
jgi:hypothetical protein